MDKIRPIKRSNLNRKLGVSMAHLMHGKEYYKRNCLTPEDDYVDQLSSFVSVKEGIGIQEAEVRVKAELSTFDRIRDPDVIMYERGDNGDKEETSMTLRGYIKSVIEEKLNLAPTFTAFIPKSKILAFLAGYTLRNVKKRAFVKKEMYQAFTDGDNILGAFKNIEQVSVKLANNATSGGLCIHGTIIRNVPGHAVLTTGTRIATSTANSHMERLQGGNRHYLSYDVALDNIVCIVADLGDKVDRNSTYHKWADVLSQWGVKHASVEDAMRILRECTRNYWLNKENIQRLKVHLESLDSIQLSAFCFSGDLYNFRRLNPDIIRGYIDMFIKVEPDTRTDSSELAKVMGDQAQDIRNAAHHVLANDLRGLGTDYSKMPLEVLQKLVGCCDNIANTINYYKPLFQVILVNDVPPPVVGEIKNMIRSTVVASDTDSAIYTLEEWVSWYTGDPLGGDSPLASVASIAILSTQTLDHYLRQISRNYGASDDDLDILTLKPEYTWSVFALGSRSKHYYAATDIVELNVKEEYGLEIKGVGFKNKITPEDVRYLSEFIQRHIIESLQSGMLVSMWFYIDLIIEMEQLIRNSMYAGEPEFLKTLTINSYKAYKGESKTKSNYRHVNCFRYTYGKLVGMEISTPVKMVKIPTFLNTKNKIVTWVNGITDPIIKEGYVRFLRECNLNQYKTVYLPEDYVDKYGIPEEIKGIMDITKSIVDTSNMLYMSVDVLNVYKVQDMLFSDMFTDRIDNIMNNRKISKLDDYKVKK